MLMPDGPPMDTTRGTKPGVDTMAPALRFVIQPVDCLAR